MLYYGQPPSPTAAFLRWSTATPMASVAFTKKQTAHTQAILHEWLCLANERQSLPPLLHMQIKLLDSMIRDGMPLGNDEFAMLGMLLQLTIASLGPNEVDPLAEQAYAKCVGEWAILPPWYDRIRALSVDGVEPPIGT